MERSHSRLLEKGSSRIEPLLMPLAISDMAAGNVSIQFGLKGKSINVATACAAGTNSIGEAFRAIQYGDAEVMAGRRLIHRTAGYRVPDEKLDLNYCKEAYTEDFEYALSNSLGFGGHNASLIVKKYHG